MHNVAVLFARADSIYKKIPECDVYDIDRDARNFSGDLPIIGHPPCRAWGRLRAFAKPRPDEKELATWCVDQIRKNGGVLEHPSSSSLWTAKDMPRPGRYRVDAFGGWTLDINQSWWGHKADKRTWLYIVGCSPLDIPPLPFKIGQADYVVTTSKRMWKDGKKSEHHRPELSKADRERTPPAFAHWLIELALKCKRIP